ncbi:MAG: transcriptional regulator with XRE-family HTH domain [Rickettsiales bacterium]|jgi:transcriptional regulator with XRE-family HTH domain
MLVTYKQFIAARDLLGWTRRDLEKKSKISRSTLADFERGDRNLRMDNFEKLLNTFEEAGIKFVNNEEGVGVIELSKK